MKIKKYLIIINLVAVLFFFGKAVLQKESILEDGKLVLLELAPVDPRSLIQGDYMRLHYKVSDDIMASTNQNSNPTLNDLLESYSDIPKRGALVLQLDSLGVGSGVRIHSKNSPLKEREMIVRYFKPRWGFNIGAESYFFQEGEGEKFESAKYGGIRVDENGNSVLVGLYDNDRKLIK